MRIDDRWFWGAGLVASMVLAVRAACLVEADLLAPWKGLALVVILGVTALWCGYEGNILSNYIEIEEEDWNEK